MRILWKKSCKIAAASGAPTTNPSWPPENRDPDPCVITLTY